MRAESKETYYKDPEGSLHDFSEGAAVIAKVRTFLFKVINFFRYIHDLLFELFLLLWSIFLAGLTVAQNSFHNVSRLSIDGGLSL